MLSFSSRSDLFTKVTKSKLLYKSKNIIFDYLINISLVVPFIILLRLYEFLSVLYKTNVPTNFIKLETIGAFLDNEFWLRLFLYIAPIFIILSFFSQRLANIFYRILICLLIIIQISLVQYFIMMFEPLGQAFFRYSITDIWFIISASGGFSIINILTLLLFPLLYIFTFHYYKRKIIQKKSAYIVLILVFFISGIFCSLHIRVRNYMQYDNADYFKIVNKQDYFYNSAIAYFRSKEKTKSEFESIKNEIVYYHNLNNQNTYLSDEYPLIRKKDTSDVLGSLFYKFDKKPNIVILLIESLSSSYCGPDARFVSFTPYLDSLINHSLYWENCLSSTERSFGILSSVLGSLPYGEIGFSLMYENMPAHQSLITILNDNDYYTSYAYGAPLKFDGMGAFIRRQKTDLIMTEYGHEKDIMGWAFPDGIVFKRFGERIDSLKTNIAGKPRLDVLYTGSTHEPFVIPNQKHYQDLAKKIILKSKQSENVKKDLLNYNKAFSSFLYTDEKIMNLIQWYKNHADFNNTIFIITGDHRVETYCWYGIDRFRVPLIIYSPKLKKNKSFKSVVNHWEITPSILSFLSKNCNIEVPNKVHWLGGTIDTFKYFRNIHDFVPMKYDRNLDNYLSGNYYLHEGKLYLIDSLMNLTEVKNDPVQVRLKHNLEAFKAINYYVCRSDKLIFSNSENKKKIVLYEGTKPDKDFNNTIEYFNIIPDTKIPDKTTTLAFDVSFEVYPEKESINSNPIIAFGFTNNKQENVYWEGSLFKTLKGEPLKIKTWGTVSIHKVFNLELRGIKPNNIFYTTLWNYKVLEEFKIKNIRVKVEADYAE
jgi:phosphoglycerol transferase MdoB-like AlkP superfamily enzyme